MKRAIVGEFRRFGTTMLAVVWLTGAAGCSAPPPKTTQAGFGASTWVMTPMIQKAERTSGGLTVSGFASPGERVVVRGGAGTAYATSADSQGRFTLKIGVPAADALFVVETQVGQDAAPAPYRLFVTHDANGPVALLTPGGPSQRLDEAGPLDVVDGDGRAVLASGRSAPGSVVAVGIGGSLPSGIRTGPNGRWVDQLKASTSAISVGDRHYVRPLAVAPAAKVPLSVTVAGDGRLVQWETPEGAVQQTWFPNAS